MRYFKMYKCGEQEAVEITKDEARRTLTGHWDEKALKDIFDNDRGFRLFTPYAEVWTMSDDGLVPMAGFYGIVG